MKSYNTKIQYYLFLALAFFIPVHGKLIPITIVLIVLSWLIEFNFKGKYALLKNSVHRKNILAFGILYILYVIGTLYSTQLKGQEGALFDLEVKLSILIFPLLFSTIDFSLFKEGFFNRVLVFFVAGSLFSGMVFFGLSFYDYFERGNDLTAFFYTNFAHWQHPSYLALYYAFSIAVLLTWLVEKTQVSNRERFFYFLLILCFQLLIVVLSSKAGILATAVLYIMAFVYLLAKKNLGVSKRFWIPLFLLVSFLLTLILFPQSYGRFISVKSTIENRDSLSTNTHESSAARLIIWKSALEVIKRNPVFGVGTGDVKQELGKVHKISAGENYLNAHNQYIQTTVVLGVVGLLVLVLSFLLPAIWSFKRNSLLYLLFLVLVSFHFLVESMLERQAGVVFYAFFNSLLFYFMAGRDDIHQT